MPENMFSDLIPKDAPKPKRAPGGNMFADLIPQPVQHAPGVTGQRGVGGETEGEQQTTVGRKGDRFAGSRIMPDTNLAGAEGALLNLGTEVGGAVQALVDLARQGKIPAEAMAIPPIAALIELAGAGGRLDPGYGEAYQQRKAGLDAQLAASREMMPAESAIKEGAGMVGTAGLTGARALQAPRLLMKVARGATAGGVVGGIAGAGEGEGVRDRVEKGAAGLRQGALIGAVVPPIAAGIGQGVRLVRAAARGATAPMRALADPETFAAQKVAEATGRDSLTPQRVELRLRQRQALKPDLVMADVGGKNTKSLLRAAANVPSDARDKLTRTLFNRQEKQLDRLTTDIGAAFGDPKTFHSTVENLALARKQNAEPMFRIAFQTGTPWTVPLQSVLSRPLTRKLVARAEEAAANRGEEFKAIFAQVSPDGKVRFARVPDTEALHRVKMEIDAAIGQLKKREETGLGNVNIRDLTILKRDLLNAIENPRYKKALSQYAGDSAAVNALDEGFEEGQAMEPEAIVARLKGLSEMEADLWRLGYARRVVNQLRDAGRAGTNRAEILNAPKYLSRLRAAMKDSSTGRDFLRKLAMERQMFATKTAVEGNSTSAAQLAEGLEGGVEAENIRQAIDTGRALVRGDAVGALASWFGRARNYMTGLRPEVADQILKMLTSRDPATIQRAQQLVQKELDKLAQRRGAPSRVESGVNVSGFSLVPGYASGGQ